MEEITVRLHMAATPSAPALVLRPWQPADVPALAAVGGDNALRRWTSWDVEDEADAARWVRAQQWGWEAGNRFAFAVVEAPAAGAPSAETSAGAASIETSAGAASIETSAGAASAETSAGAASIETSVGAPDGHPVGHVVLKRPVPGAPSAEVGYWTVARARGRGVAPRALRALTDWAFAALAGDGLVRLELRHQVDNEASCRVARKCRYELTALLPAAPPAFPLDGHVHVRARES